MAAFANEATGEIAQPSRRDFIFIATAAGAAVGVTAVAWPFIDQMNPAADTRALAITEVDLSAVAEGQQIIVLNQSKAVFVRHRTPVEIEAAQRDDYATLKDPASDASRLVQSDGQRGKPAFLIVWAACTHLGCIPGFGLGDYHGWKCACHGSQYDTSGRIRSGPAPKNLYVAPYVYLSDRSIRIG